jgi:SAM-dependent methyltransferase
MQEEPMADANERQILEWNGAVGARWAAEQEQTDPLIRPFGEAAIAAAGPRPGERVLDVGCGCGDTSLALSQIVGPAGQVVGVDVSKPMLEVARKRGAGAANLTFLEADASRGALPGPFDLLYSRFGVMFFDDPTSAFARLRTSLTSAGRLAFAAWQGPHLNPWAAIPATAARQASGLPPAPSDPHAPGPFAFADVDRVKAILAAAGFGSISANTFTGAWRLGSSARSAAEAALRIGPAARVAREAGQEKLPAMIDAVAAALAPLAANDGAIVLPARIWVVTAKSG